MLKSTFVILVLCISYVACELPSDPNAFGTDERFVSKATAGNKMQVTMEDDGASSANAAGTLDGQYTADVVQQLDTTINQISSEIVEKGAQIKRESKWIAQVNLVITEYNKKILKVQRNVATLRKQVRDLLKKKRQVQNLKLQKQLEQRLSDATSDLDTLNSAIDHVTTKEKSFSTTRHKLENTIANLNLALGKLKGEDVGSGESLGI
jgi:chromosome segregation ATPase